MEVTAESQTQTWTGLGAGWQVCLVHRDLEQEQELPDWKEGQVGSTSCLFTAVTLQNGH